MLQCYTFVFQSSQNLTATERNGTTGLVSLKLCRLSFDLQFLCQLLLIMYLSVFICCVFSDAVLISDCVNCNLALVGLGLSENCRSQHITADQA